MLMTAAAKSASDCVHAGPGTIRVKSTSNRLAMAVRPAFDRGTRSGSRGVGVVAVSFLPYVQDPLRHPSSPNGRLPQKVPSERYSLYGRRQQKKPGGQTATGRLSFHRYVRRL